MKKVLKQILLIILITIVVLLTNTENVQAALQSNPNTQYTKTDTGANWMTNFRKMETAGQAMGLSETLNSDLTASSESNNIDIHMIKATEYGAMAILSASGYGNPSNDRAITTTTGNNTGIILNTSYCERVAAGISALAGENSRYYNTYTSNVASAKIGDALGTSSMTNAGCSSWHSATYAYLPRIKVITEYMDHLARGNGGIFSYTACNDDGFYNGSNFSRTGAFYSRGVAICGDKI